MVSVNLICVGKMKEQFLKDACAEYAKRLNAFSKLSIIELDEFRLPENPSDSQIDSALSDEARRISTKIDSDSFVVAMCIEGKTMSSEKLAEKMAETINFGSGRFTFIIGGSCGLSNEIKQRADLKLSMSPMTFPHHLARVMLLEQIYRAFMINANTRYHK